VYPDSGDNYLFMAKSILNKQIAPGTALSRIVSLLYGGIGASLLRQMGSKPIVRQLGQINKFIRLNAEGSGDLTQRLQVQEFAGDETRELAKWINNMIDSLEGIMLQVKQAAAEVQISQERMNESTGLTEQSTGRMSTQIHDMIRSLRGQLKDIDVAKDVTQNMSGTLRELEEKASDQIAVAQDEVDRIGDKMNHIKPG
jgi:methyl-accepting chemotaxis protein